MIVTVRRWTSLALPRLSARSKEKKQISSTVKESSKREGFLDTYHKMFEHQINLMFKDEFPK